MTENKKQYIEQLLSVIKSLHESVQEVRSSENLPFSFFKESFNNTQEITSLLHKLEFLQVDDLKSQMERLLVVLSEKENREQKITLKAEQEEIQKTDIELSEVKDQNLPEEQDRFQTKDNNLEPDPSKAMFDESTEPETEIKELYPGNKYAKGIVLPEYRNPYSAVDTQNKKDETRIVDKAHSNKLVERVDKEKKADFKNSSRSLNDVVQTPPTVIDLKRGISLNDRFLFQRELFGNDRQKMNSTIEKLNDLKSYEEAEDYVRENVSADLEDPTVSDFLLIIKKGFK